MAAGDYTIVIRLGGRQTRKNIAVTAGSLNELQVNAGTLTVNSLTTNGESLSDGFKVFDPEDKAHQGALMEAMTGDPVTLTPGSYTVIVGEYTGFPLVMDVALAAGESLSLDARWKQIEVPFIANLSGSEFVFLREEVEGADTSDWRSVTSPQIRRTGNGAIVYVPEGTYSARSHEDEIVTGLKAK